MKCPECLIDIPNGVNFCHQCGAELEKFCSHCKSLNPPQSKFCGDCGHKFSSHSSQYKIEKSFNEKITKIQRYLPSGLVEKILSQKEKIEGERKQVTVMFCDMASFTHLSEGWGAEEAFIVMDQVYEILIHQVHNYEGTVNEMTGDGIMALFGAPIAIEDAAVRAIQSSLAIHKEIALLSDKYIKENKLNIPLQMRIGIHTGLVIVGTLGNDLRVEFKAVGDTVNIAARLENLARPGTTIVSGITFKLAEGFFQFEALGEMHVKGIEKALSVLKVISPDSKRTRFDVHVERGLIPLIGRQRELDLLLESLDRIGEGYGHAITIVAEAGMGKSRLIYEFKQYVSENHYTLLIGNCLSYNISSAFFCIAEIFKMLFDIQDSNSDEEVILKTRTALKKIGLCELCDCAKGSSLLLTPLRFCP
jgi:class 3 adenylate cyclase